ncbi:hypothetical protein C7377_0224 [Balneicella halophila]|uniref:Uncharacterized protein n=1 Tax=Balneicella halophila TaxID=1537566 RepID=A0A7L4UQ98_BALHA|nr:hypothetical protein [Balneicella halophila]PVX51930.1 hypothetical protein C7377_0224 [Balneicella halophila]
MKRTLLTIIVLISVIIIGNAQQNDELYYMGHSYYEDANGVQHMVPFAVVKLCEVENPENVLAVRLSEAKGRYIIRNIDVEQEYILKVYAPNVKEQWFKVPRNNGRIKKYNINIDAKLEVPENYNEQTVSSQKFKPYDFNKKTLLEQMILQLPMIEEEDGEFTTLNGGSVKLWLNGGEADMQTYEKIKNFRAKDLVEYMEYFNVSETENPIYDGVLNIMLKVGDRSEKPSWRLVPIKKIEQDK